MWVQVPPRAQTSKRVQWLGEQANCFACERDLKLGALREFSDFSRRGERRESRPEENFRQEIYRKEVPPRAQTNEAPQKLFY